MNIRAVHNAMQYFNYKTGCDFASKVQIHKNSEFFASNFEHWRLEASDTKRQANICSVDDQFFAQVPRRSS